MESGDAATYYRRCGEIYGITTDQGTEKSLADVNMSHVAGSGDRLHPSARAYPNALYMPEHLHIIYNALEHSVKKIPLYAEFVVKLRAVEDFLSDKSLRRLFVATCVPVMEEKLLFSHYSVVHIDWRWEFLSIALTKLVVLMPVLRQRLHVDAMVRSEAGSIKPTVVEAARKTLDTPGFVEFCEMLLANGNILETFAHRLEGCECHRDLWMSRRKFGTKKRMLSESSGFAHCFTMVEKP